jgi:hypothetical protein
MQRRALARYAAPDGQRKALTKALEGQHLNDTYPGGSP